MTEDIDNILNELREAGGDTTSIEVKAAAVRLADVHAERAREPARRRFDHSGTR
ncbi:hypothetical protein GCM10027447_07850 [Glycomyces halotolerans]